ncbi:MAG: N-acetyl-gamma-glutamyl-phosphate reductase, partial [Betaproteobacteria bacterium]
APGWVYGFAELAPGQRETISCAARVSNPGCYATGAIALLRPLIDAGLIHEDSALALSAVSGYSGGGRSMIEAFERHEAPEFEVYALGLTHKHLPEILRHTGMTRRPILIPAVGNFRQGMLVQLPLHLESLPGAASAADLHAVLLGHYAGCEWVSVQPRTENGKLDALALNDTNRMELRVFANDEFRQAVLIARLDNLGKGASGAAVQNLKLMMGI